MPALRLRLLALVVCVCSLPAHAQTTDELLNRIQSDAAEVQRRLNEPPPPPPAPVDAVVSDWSFSSATAWSTCSGGLQSRTETWTRTVLVPAQNGGTTPPLLETRTTTQACTMPTPPSGAFPTPSTVGIPAGTTLRSCGSSATISADNAVIDGCTYTGSLSISGNNVTIRNSRIKGSIRTVQGDATARFTVERSDIGPDSGCGSAEALIGYQNYSATGNYVHNNGDGFRVAGSNILIENNFVKLCSNSGDHSDGIQGYFGGTNVIVRGNTIDQRNVGSATAPIFFADNSRSATVTNNLLLAPSASSFALRIHDDFNPDVGPWVITGNRLIGLALTTNTQCGASSMTWSDNRQVTIDSNFTVVALGSTVGC